MIETTLLLKGGTTPDADQPTWTLYLSGSFKRPPGTKSHSWAMGLNMTVSETIGVWEGSHEHGVRIDCQASKGQIEYLLGEIAERFPNLQWVHVERRDPANQYVNLEEYR